MAFFEGPIKDGVRYSSVFQHQADATISQNNPVSATLYTLLDTTANVRIISAETHVTWAVTQPTPLDIVMTIDGVSVIFRKANPVSATPYYARWASEESDVQAITADNTAQYRAFLLEGRSIKVEARVTWAVTQPTPLVCRVKWARIP